MKEVQFLLHLFSCYWQDYSAVFESAERPFGRRHREGVFLRFAIVNVHRTFTSPPRSRRR